MSGWLEQRLPGDPSVITRRSDWEAFAATLRIKDVPGVNFRTHFLFVHVSTGYCQVSCAIDGDGDLRAVGHSRSGDGRERGGMGFGRGGLPGPCYLIKSFPRSAVKTVNGLPLPKR